MWKGTACVLHIDILHGERVVSGCNTTAIYCMSMADMCFFLYAEALECTSSAESVWHVWTNFIAAEHGKYLLYADRLVHE